MTESGKSYSAPQLDSLSLRATRGIDINIGGPGPGLGVNVGLLGS